MRYLRCILRIMRIKLENFNKNVQSFVRDCGYRPLAMTIDGELNCVRPLAGQNYPRFHCYIKEENGALLINLHLDQKKPSYEGSSAHSGEYEGEIVESEAERIKSIGANPRHSKFAFEDI